MWVISPAPGQTEPGRFNGDMTIPGNYNAVGTYTGTSTVAAFV